MLNSFLKDSITYAIPALLSRGIGLFLLPIYTRYLSPQEYGVIELLTILFAILNILIPLEITQAEARLLPDAKMKIIKKQLASTAFWFTAIGFSNVAVIIWVHSTSFSLSLFGSEKYNLDLRVASLSMIVNALFYVVQNHLRWCLLARESAFVGIIYSILVAFISIYLVVVLKLGVTGVLVGQLISGMLALIIGITLSFKNIPITFLFKFSKLKEMLVYSTPLVFSGIAVYINTYIDRWLINAFLGVDDVGIYGVAYRVALIPGLVMYAFQMALAPLIFHNYSKNETPSNISRLFNYFLVIILPVLLIISLFADDFIRLLTTEQFYSASELVFILCISIVFMNMYIFFPGLGIKKLTSRIAVINIFASTTNVIFNIILIPKLGIKGAAISTLIGSIAMAVLYYYWGNKKYKIPYDYKNIILSLIILSTFILFFNIFEFNIIQLILFIIVFISMLFFLLFSSEEKKEIFDRLSKINIANK